MKSRSELHDVIQQIAAADSPVGMDAVYVHALILDKLEALEQRLGALETACAGRSTDETDQPQKASL